MTRSAPSPDPRVVASLAVSLLFATPTFAQGTDEQREACTSDAIRLCPDAIPDVDRTTACMKAHEAQLSRRCHRVFSAETEAPAGRSEDRVRRTARVPRGEDDVDTPRRRSSEAQEEYDAPRGYGGPGSRDAYDTSRGYGPGPAAGYDRDYAPGPDDGYGPGPQEDDVPRRVERVPSEPYAPDGDGYGPRRYLYMTPRGQTETPDDAD